MRSSPMCRRSYAPARLFLRAAVVAGEVTKKITLRLSLENPQRVDPVGQDSYGAYADFFRRVSGVWHTGSTRCGFSIYLISYGNHNCLELGE